MINVFSYRWKDAFAACQSLNGSQMISISSKEENDFVANLAKVFTFFKFLPITQVYSQHENKSVPEKIIIDNSKHF